MIHFRPVFGLKGVARNTMRSCKNDTNELRKYTISPNQKKIQEHSGCLDRQQSFTKALEQMQKGENKSEVNDAFMLDAVLSFCIYD